ncbi:Flagellar basal-body rod protein FlgG [Poriferisphaera corsica]|uniref:Flagellar basal-body rod protein FlgG n=1 Tax=Poriferisphaera corsica TaxID=2528020 RepID=A0A517YR25_9BACT|nr:flagellar basal-body rod protein FlgG [Poriferisphaera corsica]QDU32686.1 Flagellar basal-body rod protein FlgG [Poriferisphaera corsica]
MAISALHSAASGLSSLSTSLDVISNNLANMNTVGFKASRVNFEDLLYEQKAQPGVQNEESGFRPHGIQVGLGTRVSGTSIEFTQGDRIEDPNPYSMAINGEGFFRVQILSGLSEDGFGYTRAGNFSTNADGELVLGTTSGPRLDPPINIPDGTTTTRISETGGVYAVSGDGTEQQIGQVELYNFANPSGLTQIGGNIYVEGVASGPNIPGNPGDISFGRIQHKFLESSNVTPTTELVTLITTQRAFEMNSQTIKAADETLKVISNLKQ